MILPLCIKAVALQRMTAHRGRLDLERLRLLHVDDVAHRLAIDLQRQQRPVGRLASARLDGVEPGRQRQLARAPRHRRATKSYMNQSVPVLIGSFMPMLRYW